MEPVLPDRWRVERVYVAPVIHDAVVRQWWQFNTSYYMSTLVFLAIPLFFFCYILIWDHATTVLLRERSDTTVGDERDVSSFSVPVQGESVNQTIQTPNPTATTNTQVLEFQILLPNESGELRANLQINSTAPRCTV